MEGLGLLIAFFLFLIFGVPAILLIIGLAKLRTKKDSAKVFIILSVVWLLAAGGICASMAMW
jgi:hypothetical protein